MTPERLEEIRGWVKAAHDDWSSVSPEDGLMSPDAAEDLLAYVDQLRAELAKFEGHKVSPESHCRCVVLADSALAEVERLRGALRALVSWCGVGHRADCPADELAHEEGKDVCECDGAALTERVNSALSQPVADEGEK